MARSVAGLPEAPGQRCCRSQGRVDLPVLTAKCFWAAPVRIMEKTKKKGPGPAPAMKELIPSSHQVHPGHEKLDPADTHAECVLRYVRE